MSQSAKKKVTLNGTAQMVQNGPCTVTAIRGQGNASNAAYIQVFDAAAAGDVTPGTTVGDWWVKSETGDPSLGDGLPTDGAYFENGVVAVSTTTVSNGTGTTQVVVFCIK